MGKVDYCKRRGIFLHVKQYETTVTVVCSCEVFFYCHLFCLTDITVSFIGLVFKKQHNESPYGKSVTVTEMVFTKQTVV